MAGSMSPEVTGLALHSGAPSAVSVARRAEDGEGLRFGWPGFDGPLTARDLPGLRRSARRATELENRAGGTIRTPEHLLAAALFFSDAPLDILCDTAEPPGLDGSALPFFRLFADASSASPRAREYDSDVDWEYSGPEGFLRARPDTHFSVQYVWEDGEVREEFMLESAGDAVEAVLPARTFIAWRDWEKLTAAPAGSSAANLLGGAGAESGLLVASCLPEFEKAQQSLPESRGKAFPLIHPESFRFEGELARHKVLDLLGDLALNGLALPRLRLNIRNGGHALNHLLLDRLQAGS
jgi:UDP-3-O-acyl-N-acetylglucosamine deacetylase